MKKNLFLSFVVMLLFSAQASFAGDVRLQEQKTMFMKTCLGEGTDKDMCLCTFERARATIDSEEFDSTIRNTSAAVPANAKSLRKFQKAGQDCAKKFAKGQIQPSIDATEEAEPALVPPPPPPPLSVGGADPIAIPQPPAKDDLSSDSLSDSNPAKEDPAVKKKKTKKKKAEPKPKKSKYYGQYDSQFFAATMKGDLLALKAISAELPSVDIKDSSGNTPLMLAAIYGQEVSMKFLLEAGAKPNALNNKNQSALHLTSYINRPDMVEELLSYGAKPDLKYGTGFTALMLATMRQDDASVNAILKYKAKPDLAADDGNTAMHIAAGGQNMKVIGWLVTYGAKIDTKNKLGYTPLMLAAYNGNAAAVQTLLGYKANAGLKDNAGRTAAQLAQMAGHFEIAQFLASR